MHTEVIQGDCTRSSENCEVKMMDRMQHDEVSGLNGI